MNNKEELILWWKLCKVRGLGPKKLIKLIDLFSSISEIYSANDEDLLRSRILTYQMVDEWKKIKSEPDNMYEKIIEDAESNNIFIMPLFSPLYPVELKIIASPPLTLFMQGDLELLKKKKVAIVGSRKSDNESKRWTYNITHGLIMKDIIIVSGGAIGIDIEAHRAALEQNGKTICVLASGLLKPTPESHIKYFNMIREKGLLISENPPDFSGSAIALLRRNRIISAISDAMIVVTSSDGSGTMTQMDHAYDQKIPILCPPEKLNFTPHEGITKKRLAYNINEVENVEQIFEIINKKKASFLSYQQKL